MQSNTHLTPRELQKLHVGALYAIKYSSNSSRALKIIRRFQSESQTNSKEVPDYPNEGFRHSSQLYIYIYI